MGNESIKNFVENFFKNLKCTLSFEEGVLTVSNVPKDFEDFSGRQQPYYLIFDKKYDNGNTELMTKGSYLLKTMMEYLEDRGKTTLLKLVFDFDFEKIFGKKFNLVNCNISNVTRKQEYDFIIRFTFLTSFQYLNQKETLTNFVCVKDNSLVDIELDNFEFAEGRKEDVKIPNLKEDYDLAKRHLKEISEKRTFELHKLLKDRIEKEISRVKKHCESQKKEYNNSVNKILNQIANLGSSKNKEAASKKIFRLKKSLKDLKESNTLENIEKEENFYINDEIHKHSLSVNHKLINTSIFYYPQYVFTIFLKSLDGGRIMELDYNPVFNELGNITCDSCKLKLRDLVLCSGGHISCRSCSLVCKSCKKSSCIKCIGKGCGICELECCKKCLIRCNRCNKKVCKSHSTNSGFYNICSDCLKKCNSCGKSCDPNQMCKSPEGQLICENCQGKIARKRIESVFER